MWCQGDYVFHSTRPIVRSMHEQTFFTYMMVSFNGTLHTGMTRDISSRVEQHRRGAIRRFSSKYKTKKYLFGARSLNLSKRPGSERLNSSGGAGQRRSG